MELTVDRKQLTDSLETVTSVVPSKPAIASLSCVLVETKDAEVSLTATDLETTIKTSLPATVSKKGQILLPARKILSLVKQLDDKELKLSLAESQVNLQTSSSTYNFFPMNVEDFPKLPKFSGGISFSISSSLLRDSIQKTKFCIYPEEPRPHFRGALLDIKEDKWNFVATDTRRLALVQTNLETKVGQNVKCLLPY
ncbi:MAG TPA: DNA polymerase III subunit beta, partial [bacterium]|nr:DNA polymerase III subunit beta [bacterium]